MAILVLDTTFTECKKMELAQTEILKLEERMTSDERKLVDFSTNMAIQGTLMALEVTNPLVGIVAAFFVGTLIDAIWPSNSYNPIRANVLKDVRNEMNYQSLERMEMKLRDYKRQVQDLFRFAQLPKQYLIEWQNSVTSHGVNFYHQLGVIKKYKKKMTPSSFAYLKNRLLALTTDIGNDHNNFFIPRDPATSLAHYREFATIELNLLTSELLVQAGNNPKNKAILNVLKGKIKSAAGRHYKFVLWAAHKASAKVEAHKGDWSRYNRAVESVLREYPMQKWKNLAGLSDNSKNIRNDDIVSLKLTHSKESWISCWGSGSKCRYRNCPGIDNPFVAGSQYKHYYKCRGEVFWIFGDLRGGKDYIRNCDKVAFRYSWWSNRNAGYWISTNENFWSGRFYNTRTCPGRSFFNSHFSGRCFNEVFTLNVKGRRCGDILQDRDAITLKDLSGRYLGGYRSLSPTKSSHRVLRIYKLYSLIKSYH